MGYFSNLAISEMEDQENRDQKKTIKAGQRIDQLSDKRGLGITFIENNNYIKAIILNTSKDFIYKKDSLILKCLENTDYFKKDQIFRRKNFNINQIKF